jgi:hypothetical protein
LFTDEVVVSPIKREEEIRATHEWRLTHNIPPGFKDETKADSGIGDSLVWEVVLRIGKERNCSVLLISRDEKNDWLNKTSNMLIAPRYELIDEFRRESGGHSIHIVPLSELVKLFGASPSTVEELRSLDEAKATGFVGSKRRWPLLGAPEQELVGRILKTIPERLVFFITSDHDPIDASATFASGKGVGILIRVLDEREEICGLSLRLAKDLERAIEVRQCKNILVLLGVKASELDFLLEELSDKPELSRASIAVYVKQKTTGMSAAKYSEEPVWIYKREGLVD